MAFKDCLAVAALFGAALSHPLTTKIDAAIPTEVWTQRYDGPAQGPDWSRMSAFDPGGDVVVFGGSSQDFYTAKYSRADGRLMWERRFDGVDSLEEEPIAMALDQQGDVFVVGKTRFATNNYMPWAIYLAKYHGNDGSIAWEKRIAPELPNDASVAGVGIDHAGNVMITGALRGVPMGSDFYTAKFSTDGALIWEKFYAGPAGFLDYATASYIDEAGNMLVAGISPNEAAKDEALLLKYAAQDGAVLWERRLTNGISIRALEMDRKGNLYAFGNRTVTNYLVKIHGDTGAVLWEKNQLGVAPGASSIKATESGEIYMTLLEGVQGRNSQEDTIYTVVVQKLFEDGSLQWRRNHLTVTNSSVGAHIAALGPNGDLIVHLNSETNFYSKLASGSGTVLWNLEWDAFNPVYLEYDSQGQMIIAGNEGGDISTKVLRDEIPPKVNTSRTGNTLELNWPAAYATWRLEMNSDGDGLGNGGTWIQVPVGVGATSATVTNSTAERAVFFRLRAP